MWILENEGGAFEGKRLWLRPGKRYLFGRTVAEPGQLAIKGDPAALKSVSRKHCTIQVDPVTEGDGCKPSVRSRVTIEDLGSKSGTRVNDQKIKGEKYVLTDPINTLQMGSFHDKFKISWFPVTLTYSFSAKELRADPFAKLQQTLEPLDIKYTAEYDNQSTTHVVHKKRNTPKGLQALINGIYIVNDGFVNAVLAAAAAAAHEQVDNGVDRSALEADFDGSWPDAMHFLPPASDDAAPIPSEQFAPNPARANIFDGYTFVFYEKKQHESLMAPITAGKGKALLSEVVPGQTQIDDFIRYVKGVAGEKGLGEFEDGSEGKGVVVVQFMPTNQEHLDWYSHFYTTVSLRLDQRLITQKDFLPAILSNDASGLRRPLEEESGDRQQTTQSENQTTAPEAMDVDNQQTKSPPRPASRRRQRGGPRFRGFGVAIDEEDEPPPAPAPAPVPTIAPPAPEPESSQEGLFVSQDVRSQDLEELEQTTRRSQRKRPAPAAAPDANESMDYFAPTAAQVKRRRIAAGEEVPTAVPATPPEEQQQQQKQEAKTPKIKKELDVLDLARQHREEAEARAKAEREELARAPEGLDLAEIRRLQIQEPMELRRVPSEEERTTTRDRDVAAGRWDPAWNGRKNFKRFQRRGAAVPRAPQRIIVPLEEVQPKAFGIGDDYWLEDGNAGGGGGRGHSRSMSRSLPQRDRDHARNGSVASSAAARGAAATTGRRVVPLAAAVDGEDEEDQDMLLDDSGGKHSSHPRIEEEDDDDDDEDISITAPRTRNSRASTTQRTTQRTTTTSNTTQPSQRRTRGTTPSITRSTSAATATATAAGTKRPAAARGSSTRNASAKRPRVIAVGDSEDDDDDGDGDGDDGSEDELRFRFGRR